MRKVSPSLERHIVNWTLPRELYPPTSRCFQLWQTRYTRHRIFSEHCFRGGGGEGAVERAISIFLLETPPILLFFPISTSPLLSFILYTFPRLSSDFHAVFHRVFRFSSRPFEWAERLKWFFEANLSHRIRIILECYSRCERSIWNEILSRSWRSWILERCIIDTYLFIEMDDRKGDFFEIFVYSREVGKVSKESFYIYLKVVGKIFDIVFLILCNERRNYRWRLLINL